VSVMFDDSIILSVENLSVGYEKPLVSNLRFFVREGDCLGIVGPNGAGKSTLVRTLLSLIPPLSGSVSFLGEKMEEVKPEKRIRLGYVPQRTTVDLSFPVNLGDVIYMSLVNKLRLNMLSSSTLDDVIQSVLNRFGFDDPNTPLRKLSGGQLQRLLIARAFVNEPILTIMDEPTSNLDPAFTERFYEILAQEKEKGNAFILVSHDVEGISRIVNKCLTISFEGWELKDHA